MKDGTNTPLKINSISEFHQSMSLKKPKHPLISLVNFKDIVKHKDEVLREFVFGFYTIAIKKDFKGKFKYGQNHYDFDEGVMSFISPGQLLSESNANEDPISGHLLMFHPDFLRGYALEEKLMTMGFFSYSLCEALYLSEDEQQMIEGVMNNIGTEYNSSIDLYSQDVMISHLEVLLNYSNRFYNRQFITRKHINNDLLANLEKELNSYMDSNASQNEGLPTVQMLSKKLNVSPSYLSDMLKGLTGLTVQQHIQEKLIDKAKTLLSTTSLRVAEVAYLLGFEHPQSLNRIFKKKTDVSPLQYRRSFFKN
ncbi:hypothetical protein LCGC14_2345440 [marine sediment metagenome]|uniref:AraC family transcriptional regulator n=2 Tax=root TaxID=1 RepID=A0A831QSL9_9FLAO|nr:AraC family transcriptional regulator [Pricia antarctica]